MNLIKPINATAARNDFFNLLKKSYFDKQIFLIKKAGIPISFLIPAESKKARKKKGLVNQSCLLDKIAKLRRSMTESSDSVSMLRKVRLNEN